jgi:hypothetical protein
MPPGAEPGRGRGSVIEAGRNGGNGALAQTAARNGKLMGDLGRSCWFNHEKLLNGTDVVTHQRSRTRADRKR